LEDTSILCSNSDPAEFVAALKAVLLKLNEWFSINSLTMNLNKTNCIHFTTKLKMLKDINVIYEDTQIHNTCNVNFLGLIIDSNL
jgi:hypothetical protein